MYLNLFRNGCILLTVTILTLFNAQSVNAQQKYVVVSDYDDTFRITGHGGITRIWNALFTDKVYAGNPELYQALEKEHEALYFVSNSPEWLRKKITRRIGNYQLTPDSIFLHTGTIEKFQYKLASVRWILKQHPKAHLILLGDNATADHLVYAQIRKEFPNRVAVIYIHSVQPPQLEKGIQLYYTAFEVAYFEMIAKRSSKESVQKVGLAITAARQKRIAPHQMYVPTKRAQLTIKEPELEVFKTKIFDLVWQK